MWQLLAVNIWKKSYQPLSFFTSPDADRQTDRRRDCTWKEKIEKSSSLEKYILARSKLRKGKRRGDIRPSWMPVSSLPPSSCLLHFRTRLFACSGPNKLLSWAEKELFSFVLHGRIFMTSWPACHSWIWRSYLLLYIHENVSLPEVVEILSTSTREKTRWFLDESTKGFEEKRPPISFHLFSYSVWKPTFVVISHLNRVFWSNPVAKIKRLSRCFSWSWWNQGSVQNTQVISKKTILVTVIRWLWKDAAKGRLPVRHGKKGWRRRN